MSTQLQCFKINRLCLRIALVICVVISGSLAILISRVTEAMAQETGETAGRWQITPSVSLYEQFTDNVDLNYEKPVSALITEFSPGVMFELPSPRRQLRINTNLKLDNRNRSDGNVETLYWYNFWGYLGRQYSPRTTYELNLGYDIYYTEVDVSSPFVNVFGSLTRSDVFYIQPGLSYDVTKTTNVKLGVRYGFSTYADEGGVGGEDMEGSLYITQKVGSRIILASGYIYRDISYDNETGYTEGEVPINVRLDLTYLQLNLRATYVTRDYQSRAGDPDNPLGSQNFLFYGVGFDLGGQLLKLRSTTVEVNYETKLYDDLYGFPYENQELRLSIYHAFKKFDIFSDLRYGLNDYVGSSDKMTYWGAAAGLKYYISDKAYLGFNVDFTSYDYQLDETNGYDLLTGSIEYNHRIYDWLSGGLGYGHREGKSDVEEGNYAENSLSLFARATW